LIRKLRFEFLFYFWLIDLRPKAGLLKLKLTGPKGLPLAGFVEVGWAPMAIKKDREHFPVKTDPTPNWGARSGDRLKTKVSHMEVFCDLNYQKCLSSRGASFFPCFEMAGSAGPAGLAGKAGVVG